MAIAFQKFVEDLTGTGLVSKADVRQAIGSLPLEERSDSDALANCLVDTGRLTGYQARRLARGDSRSLVVGKYLLLEQLGRDAIGRLYKARHRKLDRIVVLKILDRHLEDDPDSVERFRHEMQTVAKLTHPNIVQALDAGRSRGRLYLAMEYIRGTDFDTLATERGPLEFREAVGYILQAAQALQFAHERGIWHRDIRPSNLMLDEDGRVKILEFGLATFAQGGARPQPVQSDAYMSPERLAASGGVDLRSDVFSLGAVLYLLLSGRSPAGSPTGTSNAALVEFPTLPSSVPQSLQKTVDRMLARSPEHRLESMAAVVRELSPFAPEGDTPTGHDVVAPPTFDESGDAIFVGVPAPQPPRRRESSRHKGRLFHSPKALFGGMLGAICLIGGAALVWQFRQRPDNGAQPSQLPPVSGAAATTGDDSVPQVGVEVPLAGPVIPATSRVQVFIMAGQSNMAGRGSIADLAGLVDDPAQAGALGHLQDEDGEWAVRDDVWIRSMHWGQNSGEKRGPLTIGFGQTRSEIGPELGFGRVVGDACEDSVLIIKATRGPLALAVDGRPPSSGGERGVYYEDLTQFVRETLQSLDTLYPDLSGKGHEIAGFVWLQGWNDMIDPVRTSEYGENLRNLIHDLRRDWNAPRMVVVIGELGQRGVIDTATATGERRQILKIRTAQRETAELPEFRGTVRFVETVPFVRDGPGRPFLFGENAQTFYEMGEAFGTAMVDLLRENAPEESMQSTGRGELGRKSEN